jgi:CDP-diacylglycerol--glycerol-3-phosphate 3-phosphatidyltransferase
LVTVIIIGRDIVVDMIRLIMIEKRVVIAASKLGKLKTLTQMIVLIIVLLLPGINFIYLPIIPAVISLISGIEYFNKNKEVLLSDLKG